MELFFYELLNATAAGALERDVIKAGRQRSDIQISLNRIDGPLQEHLANGIGYGHKLFNMLTAGCDPYI